ncbi:F-box/LRR-repeat protein [Trifolium pratense]|uniref:F-box/LRR-repeat protein n=1 Tax=Trifolium pratense TaxID=57577 RepID=A0A2K3LD52_TRIPR|nr:F-box/LRR-repeat protein [Trifolium pratense]
MQTNITSQQIVAEPLPDDCWESIFRFVIKDDDDCNNNNYLNSLSLVSKRFLSIIDRFRFSLIVYHELSCCHLFKRFTNLNSLNLTGNYIDLDNLLIEISSFPLKQLTSLNLSNQYTIPTIGLRTFSQKITTLTSLTCSNICHFNSTYLFLIAECFPLLEELDLSYPSGCRFYTGYPDGIEVLSLALIKLRKVNLSGFPIDNQSLFHLFKNCKYLEEVVIFWCDRYDEITKEGLAFALSERPTLKSLSFSITPSNLEYSGLFCTSHFINSLVSLKGLTCLVLHRLKISDRLLYSIAKEGLPLTRLVLRYCTGHSYDGIFCLLWNSQCLQHLDLHKTDFLNDQHVVELSSFLGDLVSINLTICRKLTYLALFALLKNCPSLSEIKLERIGSAVVENYDSLVEFGVYPQLKSLYLGQNSWLNDESIIMFASVFPNLQMFDLNYCCNISEGICQVLTKCSKIKHLNLAGCSKVKMHQMNFAVPKLEVLNLSDTEVDDESLYVISKNCCGLLQLLLKYCNGVTENGVKHVVENCTQLREVVVEGSDKYRELFSRFGYPYHFH